jgi:phosphoribosylanthranilate isomerase
VQLHGNESVFMIRVLQKADLRVIKVLRSSGRQLLLEAEEYSLADAFLVEAGRGTLPGGNGSKWNWFEAQPLAERMPYILAGGLTAENISMALRESGASAVDLSSGAESSPGCKDIEKVKQIISTVRAFTPTTKTGVLFP